MTLCNMNITQNRFESNTATREGGGIYYNYKRPVMSNNTFINNQASYGPNIASYPVKIVFNDSATDNMSITDIGSGIKYENTIILALVDYDNQVIKSNSKDLININSANFSESSILSINNAQLNQGIASFNDLIFQGQPGSSNIKFVASSPAIDTKKIQTIFGSQISDNQIDASFRWCKPGEIYDLNKSCVQCSADTYSFTWNSTSCNK